MADVTVVPDRGPDPLGVIAVLVDGLDLVIARWVTTTTAVTELTPTQA